MSDDLLREATRALRDEVEEAPPVDRPQVSTITRARVMRSLHERRRSRSARRLWALPLVAVFVAGSAWAMDAGWLPPLRDLLGVEAEVPPAPSDPAPAPTPPRLGPRLDRAAPVDAPEPAPEASADEARAEEPAEEDGEVLPPDAVPAPPPSAGPRSSAPTPSGSASTTRPPSEARALYEAAHRAHFVDKDPGAALRAWDAYLRAVPKASPADAAFAVEATYNRALCLIRLGRHDDAKRALAPFAEGRYGAYRMGEARALLDALGGQAPP